MSTAQDIVREKSYFERLYKNNDRHHFIVDRYREIHHLTVDRLSHGAEVLDVGCGNGNHALSFARKGLRVTGVDLAKTAVDFCRQQFAADGLTGAFHVGDVQQLPFRDGQFDAAFMSLILHHFRDYSRVLCEAARVSQRYIFIFEPNAWNPQSYLLLNVLNPALKPRFLTPNQRAVNPREVEKILEPLGFRPVETHFATIGSTPGQYLHSWVYGVQRLLPPAIRHNKFIQVYRRLD